MRCSRFANEHHVQDTLMLVPVGTMYHGTPKRHVVGKGHTHSVAHRVLACGRDGFHPHG
jgi:hypothetical protein